MPTIQYDNEVTSEQIKQIETLVAPEFQSGDWITVEDETDEHKMVVDRADL